MGYLTEKDYINKVRKMRAAEAEFPQAKALMPIVELREAYEYFSRKAPNATAYHFFNYLQHLEDKVPIDQQRCNIQFFHNKG